MSGPSRDARPPAPSTRAPSTASTAPSSEDTLEEVPDEDDAPTLPDSPRSLPPPPPLEGPATDRPSAPWTHLDRVSAAPDTIPQSLRPSTPPR